MAATKTLRAAVVGLGLGRHHVEAYAANPAVELAALCDANAERLAGLAECHWSHERLGLFRRNPI